MTATIIRMNSKRIRNSGSFDNRAFQMITRVRSKQGDGRPQLRKRFMGLFEEECCLAFSLAEYEHPLWKQRMEQVARETGKPADAAKITGDFMEDMRLIQALQNGVPPDFDVYDAATWSVVSALSEKSVAERSRPMDFPDFTKGKWKTNPPVQIMGV